MNSCLLLSFTWATFRRANPALSPLADAAVLANPLTWLPLKKKFLAYYMGYYLSIGSILRPFRFAIALGLAPTFEKTYVKISHRLKVPRAVSIFIVTILTNVVFTVGLLLVAVNLFCARCGSRRCRCSWARPSRQARWELRSGGVGRGAFYSLAAMACLVGEGFAPQHAISPCPTKHAIAATSSVHAPSNRGASYQSPEQTRSQVQKPIIRSRTENAVTPSETPMPSVKYVFIVEPNVGGGSSYICCCCCCGRSGGGGAAYFAGGGGGGAGGAGAGGRGGWPPAVSPPGGPARAPSCARGRRRWCRVSRGDSSVPE